ncbi:hypothetical protein [Mesorhizobium sp. YR577]|uniref:hypothetical protein n=1 Tax=Mesorhizobium sp. YR577 TaxID=1884373 RepID=UPI0008F2771F|nr:hypothetical protein [Mesorhizobium sp. YR577]SFT42298.1 hypothetical protein SAMN05518861_101195 [Mesorhizobium sp. YR577]
MRAFIVILTSAIMVFAMATWVLAQEAQTPATVDAAAGLPEWEKIYAVFSHPRCANCHVEDDHPRWSGAHYGKTRFHAFNVQRGIDGSGLGNPGLRCMTCHFETNSAVLHGPPGAENWHLAPAEMVWFGKSSGEICAQIKDPARNGGRSLAEVAEHVRSDKLVGWGWNPGPGREPAPGSAEETYQAIEKWTAAGAPCP